MAASGARQEDRSAAQAQARQVQGVVAEVEAACRDRAAQPRGRRGGPGAGPQGELSPQGVAVVTVVDLADQWVVLSHARGPACTLCPGQPFHRPPAGPGQREAGFEVYYLGVLPDFATAPRAPARAPMRAPEVRARPQRPIAGARPGMSGRGRALSGRRQ
jgi:HlyD family secretion protein